MKYTSGFTSINGVEYSVEIVTNNSTTTTKEITLSSTPFETQMSGDRKLIYKPVKTQSATCAILTDEMPTDIYSATAQGTKITLYNDTDDCVEWVGYVTPCAYDMGFDEDKEEVEIECIDALATLQYIKYSSNKKDIKTFLDLICDILRKCNAYNYFYISDNLQLTRNGSESIISKLCVSESNFFDEKDDIAQSDEDVAWNCLEVLEEVCRFLGYTAIAKGDSVYFLDYDAIKAQNNTYFKYSLSGTTTPTTYTTTTLKYNRTIDGNDYAENGTKFSLDNVYNKVNVKAESYTYSDIVPDIFEGGYNVTNPYDYLLGLSFFSNTYYGEVLQNSADGSGNTSMAVFLTKKGNDYYGVFMKYYDNDNYIFHKYDKNTKAEMTNFHYGYTSTNTFCGAIPIACSVNKIQNVTNEEVSTFVTSWSNLLGTDKQKAREVFDNWLTRNGCTNLSLSNYLMLLNPTTGHIQNAQATSYPFVETNLQSGAAFLGGENCYIVISGSYNFHWLDNYRFPLPNDTVDNSSDDGNYSYAWKSRGENECYLLMRLQWGSYYWNGSEWQSSSCTFKCPYVADSDNRDDFKLCNLAFKNNEFVNNVTWRIGTDKKGLLIPSPSNEIVGGVPKLTIYPPHDPKVWWRKHPTAFRHTSYHDKGNRYPHNCVFLKNFKFEAIISDPTYSGAGDSDTIYTNVIGANNVTELSDIKMKINTFDNKKLSYSTVSIKDGNKYQYCDKLFNKSCYNGEQTWTGSGGVSSNGLRAEEHLIYKIYNQYSSPATILECNIKKSANNPIWGLFRDKTIGNGKSFIIDSINTDYKFNQENIKFIEKK